MNWKVVTLNVVLLIGIAGIGYRWDHSANVNHSLNTHVQATQRTNDQAANDLQAKQQRVQNDFQRTATDNPNDDISSVFSRNQAVARASPDITKFFATYYSFNNGQEYAARSHSLLKQGVITDRLANDDKVFSNDEIEGGTHYVDVDQLNASFDSAYSFFPQIDRSTHTLNTWTQVRYDANHTGVKSDTSTMMYRVTYDLEQHKITGIQPEATLYQNSDALDNLKGNGGLTDY